MICILILLISLSGVVCVSFPDLLSAIVFGFTDVLFRVSEVSALISIIFFFGLNFVFSLLFFIHFLKVEAEIINLSSFFLPRCLVL